MKLIIQGNVRHKANLVKQSGRWAIYFLGEESLKFGFKKVSSFPQQQKVRNFMLSANNSLNIRAEVNAWELVYITEWFITCLFIAVNENINGLGTEV